MSARGEQGLADLLSRGAFAVASAIARRDVTAVEVATASLSRLEETARLNAVVTADPARLLAEARRADSQLASGAHVGPLHGVPFTVKDVLATKGVRTTLGSRAFDDLVPVVDATAVARLRRAGALLVGKTNCPEFAFGVTTDSPAFGATLNPLGPGLSPGGSSGGEAAAVAAGVSALGLGCDFGGSLRWPAQCVGITALRPTPGRVPGDGQLPGLGGSLGTVTPARWAPTSLQGALQVVGPMGRCVADLVLGLSVLAGPAADDPFLPPVPLTDPAGIPVDAWAIGWSDGSRIGPVRAEVAAAVEAAATALAARGSTTVPLPDAFVGAHEAFNALRELEELADHRLATTGKHADLAASTRDLLESGACADPLARTRAAASAHEARAHAFSVMKDLDVVLLPVAGGPACALDGTLTLDGDRLEGWQLMAHCRAVSLLGLPVVSVPVSRSREGLPLSIQVVGHPFAEHVVLAVAATLEAELGRPAGWPSDGSTSPRALW